MVGPSNEETRYPAQPQAQQPPPSLCRSRRSPDLDIAKYELRTGQIDPATKDLAQTPQTHADDAQAMRVLAVALLENKHFDDGAAMLRQALPAPTGPYRRAYRRIELGLSEADLRRLVNSTVLFAHRADSGSRGSRSRR